MPALPLQTGDQSIEFTLAEKIRRKDHVPTKQEIEDQKRYYWNTPRKCEYGPTGELSLNINSHLASGFRKTWADGTKRRVEDLLDDFMLGVVRIAREGQREDRRREEEHKRWEEKQRVLEEERRRQEMERQRLRELESQAENWAKAERIRAYVKAVEREASSRGDLEAFRLQMGEWVSWAKRHADKLDPTKKLSMARQPNPAETDHLLEDNETE